MKTVCQFLRFSLSRLATVTIAVLCCAALPGAHTASAQEETFDQTTVRARRIEGVWDSKVTVTNPQTGAIIRTFRGTTMFIQGGSLTATNNQPNVTTTSGPQFGHWTYLGHRQYMAAFRFYRFDTDGTFAGSQRVTRTLTLDPGNQSFSGTIAFEVLDPNDTVVQKGQSTEKAVRVQ